MSREEERRDGVTTTGAGKRRHEVKEEFKDSSGKGCFKRIADVQQMMSLIINMTEVRKQSRERNRKNIASSRLTEHAQQMGKSIPNCWESRQQKKRKSITNRMYSSAQKVTLQKRGEVKRDAAGEHFPGGQGFDSSHPVTKETCSGTRANRLLPHSTSTHVVCTSTRRILILAQKTQVASDEHEDAMPLVCRE